MTAAVEVFAVLLRTFNPLAKSETVATLAKARTRRGVGGADVRLERAQALVDNGYASVAELAHTKFEDVSPPVTGAAAALLRGVLTQEARANEAANQAVDAR